VVRSTTKDVSAEKTLSSSTSDAEGVVEVPSYPALNPWSTCWTRKKFRPSRSTPVLWEVR